MKPHIQPEVIAQIAHIVRERPDMAVVSLAAGRTLDSMLRATLIAAQAVAGSADLLLASQERGVNAAQLIDSVCSPSGTTIAGLLAAENAGLSPALVTAVDAAIARDQEVSS